MKKRFYILIIALVVAAFTPAAPVRADIAPPRPPYGANIYPNGETTQVRMLAETVDLYIIGDSSKDYPFGYAKVKAVFHMRNEGQAAENLDVYFPMNRISCDYEGLPVFDVQAYPSIRDFRVNVDGLEKPATTIYRTTEAILPTETGTTTKEIDVPCWAHFPAVFPPAKEVTVQVSYIAPADVGRTSAGYRSGYISYTYILETGAGWKDTIGSADITVQMPYEINEINLHAFTPPGSVTQGREISWRLENFEPNFDTNVTFELLKPAIWKSIQNETQNVKANPKDGEAWGRLGKAYKEAFIFPKMYGDVSLYQASVEAYQHAVDLKPKDAAWHAGYAEILCHKTIWDIIDTANPNDPPPLSIFAPCFTQIKAALDLDPQQELAKDLAESYQEFGLGSKEYTLVDLSQPQPDFLVLTPPAPTQTPTITLTPTTTLTPTRWPTQTARPTLPPYQSPTPAPSLTPGTIAEATGNPPAATPDKSPNPGVCGSVILPVLVAAVSFLIRKRVFLSV